jgi:hypothetical protein
LVVLERDDTGEHGEGELEDDDEHSLAVGWSAQDGAQAYFFADFKFVLCLDLVELADVEVVVLSWSTAVKSLDNI